MLRKTPFFLVGVLILISACSPEQQLSRAKSLEKKGEYYKAWEKYQELAANRPQSPTAPEAVFRAGWIAQRQFDDCFMASTFYDEVLTRYPDSDPWAKAALLQKNSCPDYFPLIPGSIWVEVDSDTKGSNARVEISCHPDEKQANALPSQAGKLVKDYYAGAKKSISLELFYKKDQQELHEMKRGQENSSIVILKWPVEVGTKWTNRDGARSTTYQIVSLDETVSVVAGDFKDCLHVRSSGMGESAIKNEYYAPGVGRVLTSITSNQNEKRITELASYKIMDAPAFSVEETKP
jgi:hypothetical protein